MRRTWLNLVIVAICAAFAADAFAQPPGGPGGGRREGGRFGGGFGVGGGPASLLMIPEVQKELSVTEEQRTKIREELTALRPEGGDRGGFRDLSEDERRERMEAMRAQMAEMAKKSDAVLAKVLKPEQVKRLKELELQRQGVAALGRPDVAEKLSLTDEQKTKIREALEAGRPDFSAFGNLRDASEEERRKAREEMQAKREKAEADAAAVLDAEQKAVWESMVGEKFEFPQRPGFGGGRPEGGRGRPEGDRPRRERNNN